MFRNSGRVLGLWISGFRVELGLLNKSIRCVDGLHVCIRRLADLRKGCFHRADIGRVL